MIFRKERRKRTSPANYGAFQKKEKQNVLGPSEISVSGAHPVMENSERVAEIGFEWDPSVISSQNDHYVIRKQPGVIWSAQELDPSEIFVSGAHPVMENSERVEEIGFEWGPSVISNQNDH